MARVVVTGEVFEWRGPAPYVFLRVPADWLHDVANDVTYGWGMIPVSVTVGDVTWTTSLWPKDGQYLLPLKVAVQRSAGIALGDTITAELATTRGDDGLRQATLSRDELVSLVRHVRDGDAATEEQEEEWLAQIAAAVPHPRAIDLVLYPEIEVGEDATPERIVDVALRYRP